MIDFKFRIGDRVEKCTGDYHLEGIVVGHAITVDGAVRYVVEHRPLAPGLLHIYGEKNLQLLEAGVLARWNHEWETTSDLPLPEDDEIKASHPLTTGRFDLHDEAMRLVSAKHSKFALVDLVRWLLSKIKKPKNSLVPVAYRWVEEKFDIYRYDESPNEHRQCEPLYAYTEGHNELNLAGYRDERGNFWTLESAECDSHKGRKLFPVFTLMETK